MSGSPARRLLLSALCLLALLPASGLAREVDGQWLLQAQAD